MHSIWDWIFVASVWLVVYPYVIYPIFILVRSRFQAPWASSQSARPNSASIVIAAYNEQAAIPRRLLELTEIARRSPIPTEVILVSDGSTDRTPLVATEVPGVRVVVLEQNGGKALALNAGVRESNGEVIVFGDVRQRWALDALDGLLMPFSDPAVGGVSGELILGTGSNATEGVGLYWRFEKWLRDSESRFSSVVGVTGAIAAVRKELYRPIPAGTILDDVYWPLCVGLSRRRVVFTRQAQAFDALPPSARGEFSRKVRTLVGNFQLMRLLPAALAPWRNPIWFQFVSHKLARLAAPWGLLGIAVASVMRADATPYRLMLAAQVAGYLGGALALSFPRTVRWRPLSAAGSFLLLNAAAWVAFWVWITGSERRAWRKVRYTGAEVGAA